MPSDLLTEWRAFYLLEPWGYYIEMYGLGIIAAKIHNMLKPAKAKAVKPDQFIPEMSYKTSTMKSAGSFFQALKAVLFRKQKTKK
jgi:hypothetical protein